MLSRRVETFLCVSEKGSFSKAAKALYLSPVSVKQQMDSLESMIGVRLLKRTNQGITLTEAGREFHEDAKKLAYFSERMISRTRIAGEPERQIIRLGTSLIRPCKPLIDLWGSVGGESYPFDLQIVPFQDGVTEINDLVIALGKEIDCFIAPCDSTYWNEVCNIFLLDSLPVCIAMSKRHHLAEKTRLTWDDLAGETLMLPLSHDYTVMPKIAEDIKKNHPNIHITNMSAHTDAAAFNKCAKSNYLMNSYDIWNNIHPALVTIPIEWEYSIPYGIIYSAHPTSAVESFIQAIELGLTANNSIDRNPCFTDNIQRDDGLL